MSRYAKNGTMTHSERLLTAQEVAQYFGVPVATIYRWNYARTGHRALRIGKHLRYRARDLEAWLKARELSAER